MIAHLRGTLLATSPGHAIVDCHGVGYDVTVSMNTFTQLPDVGREVSLFIYTNVREDQIALFGFHLAEEKALFEKLLSVSGIGPKLAVNILGGMNTRRPGRHHPRRRCSQAHPHAGSRKEDCRAHGARTQGQACGLRRNSRRVRAPSTFSKKTCSRLWSIWDTSLPLLKKLSNNLAPPMDATSSNSSAPRWPSSRVSLATYEAVFGRSAYLITST